MTWNDDQLDNVLLILSSDNLCSVWFFCSLLLYIHLPPFPWSSFLTNQDIQQKEQKHPWPLAKWRFLLRVTLSKINSLFLPMVYMVFILDESSEMVHMAEMKQVDCLEQIKLLDSFSTCATYSELPSVVPCFLMLK